MVSKAILLSFQLSLAGNRLIHVNSLAKIRHLTVLNLPQNSIGSIEGKWLPVSLVRVLALCKLMPSSVWFDTISLGWFIVHIKESQVLFVCLFDLILYVLSTIFQLSREGSSWVGPVLS